MTGINMCSNFGSKWSSRALARTPSSFRTHLDFSKDNAPNSIGILLIKQFRILNCSSFRNVFILLQTYTHLSLLMLCCFVVW